MRVVGVALALSLFSGACTSEGVATSTPQGLSPATTTTTQAPSAASLPPTATSSSSPPAHEIGLYRVDAATLTPIPGTGPLTTGDGISGYLSPNGEWLAVHVSIMEPETNLIQVIETATGDVVTEISGFLSNFVGIDDQGVVYQMIHFQSQGPRLRKLAPGATGYETAIEELAIDFHPWEGSAFLDSERIAWAGNGPTGDSLESVAFIVVVDLTSGEATTHVMDEVTFGSIGERDFGEWTLSEFVLPAVVWDAPRNRALVVHGDEDKVTTVDLGTREVATHEWSEPTSWLGHLSAWLIPPAHADGPSSYGVTRSAVLSPTGERLYVATSVSEIVVETEEEWSIVRTPQGIEAIDTGTWQLAHRWDLPASEVTMSPDGRYLVATGTTSVETLTSSGSQAEEVVVIDAHSNEVVGRFDPPTKWPDIQFSPDRDYMFISEEAGGSPIDIVDLTSMELTGGVPPEGKSAPLGDLFGEVLLLSTDDD